MQGQAIDVAESYLSWWALAGVDYAYRDEATPLLAPPTLNPLPQAHNDSPALAAMTAPQAPVTPAELGPLPATLDAFYEWVRTSPALPGANWSPVRLLPRGSVTSGLMVFTDVPDAADIEQQMLVAGAQGKLLTAMLAAIGINIDEVLIAPLSFTRPPGGRIDAGAARDLLAIAQHHIALAKPRRILILGDRTSRALTGMDIREGRGWLRNVNHDNATTGATVTFHPRFLLERPQFKRATWEDLKLLKKELGPTDA